MSTYSYLIKPSSSGCNLKCRYCFYHDVAANRNIANYGKMKADVRQTLIKKSCAVESNAHIHYAFQGGEPTLVGLKFFEAFVKEVDEAKLPGQRITYSIQTNGTLLNEDWMVFLKKHNFLCGLSIDGFKDNHDFFRMDHQDKGTFNTIDRNLTLFKKHGIEFNILTVLTNTLAKHPHKLYQFYKQKEITHVQLIPCLPDLNLSFNPFALTPERFASFYKTFFDLWEKDYYKQEAFSVGLFDNVIPMYANHMPFQCGMLGFCSFNYVVESNGDVYPCDFYVLDEYRVGNVMEDELRTMSKNKLVQSFLSEKPELPDQCKACPFFSMCRGNCKRQAVCLYNETYCGYQDFLAYSHERMLKIAARIPRAQ